MAQLRFNGVDLTEESVLATRQWYHDACLTTAKAFRTGAMGSDDPEGAAQHYESFAAQALTDCADHTVAFRQRAYFEQTGKDVAILP